MTNKEKLEIIDKKLKDLYYSISDLWTIEAIYYLEQTKLLLQKDKNTI